MFQLAPLIGSAPKQNALGLFILDGKGDFCIGNRLARGMIQRDQPQCRPASGQKLGRADEPGLERSHALGQASPALYTAAIRKHLYRQIR